jgi:hypothetical protein
MEGTMSRLAFVGAALVAALCIFCGEAAMNKGPDGGSMRDAGAAVCCGAAQTFTKLSADTLSNTTGPSEVINTSGYSEVVVYMTTQMTPSSSNCQILPEWRPDAQTPFSDVQPIPLNRGARLQVQGTDLELISKDCGAVFSFGYAVAGVK